MINVGDVRKAIQGLPDTALVRLRLSEAPDGLDIEFIQAEGRQGALVITGIADLPEDEIEP